MFKPGHKATVLSAIILVVVLCLASALCLVGCSGSAITKPVPATPSAAVPATAVPTPPSPNAAVVDSINLFSLDLYRAISSTPGNIIISPASVYLGLAQLMAGARGQTEAEFRQALHVTLPNDDFHQLFGGLCRQLMEKNQSYELGLVSRIWVRKGIPMLKPYSDFLLSNYSVAPGIFSSTQDVNEINRWMKEQTGGQITKVVKPSSIDNETRMVLVNAAFFHGSWFPSFFPNENTKRDFHLSSKKAVSIEMMNKDTGGFVAGQMPGYKYLALRYKNSQIFMIILLPDSVDGLPVLEKSLGPSMFKLKTSYEELEDMVGEISLPKFKIETSVDLNQAMRSLGIKSVLELQAADLSGISASGPLFVNESNHNSVIQVNEEGTRTASVTEFVTAAGALDGKFIADHPFLFFIQDTRTGLILFMGRVTDPR